MTEHQHPEGDRILELALGEVTGPDRDALTAHLAGCPSCRQDYDELAAAIEHTLAAVPRVGPPPDFEQRVLQRLHSDVAAAAAQGARPARSPRQGRSSGRARPWRPVLGTAAAVLVGLLAGVGLTLGLTADAEPPATEAVATVAGMAALTTSAGDAVGHVSRSFADGEPVLVVEVTDGPVGNRYLCRLVLADGRTQAVGEWDLDAERPNSWVVPAPEPGVARVELVGESGAVWSSADL